MTHDEILALVADYLKARDEARHIGLKLNLAEHAEDYSPMALEMWDEETMGPPRPPERLVLNLSRQYGPALSREGDLRNKVYRALGF